MGLQRHHVGQGDLTVAVHVARYHQRVGLIAHHGGHAGAESAAGHFGLAVVDPGVLAQLFHGAAGCQTRPVAGDVIGQLRYLCGGKHRLEGHVLGLHHGLALGIAFPMAELIGILAVRRLGGGGLRHGD